VIPIDAGMALLFGVALGGVSFVLFWRFANPLAAWLALAGLLFYVFIYTMWLKRWSPQNIVIGGGAGAFPPLIGWVAVTGHVTWMPVLLFAIIFMWTPPHFWALALYRCRDYERVGVPMLPVVAGPDETRRQILREPVEPCRTEAIVVVLRNRAVERCADLGHTVFNTTSAARAHARR